MSEGQDLAVVTDVGVEMAPAALIADSPRGTDMVRLWGADLDTDGPAEDAVHILAQEVARRVTPDPAVDRQIRQGEPPAMVQEGIIVLLEVGRSVIH
jgi:hypothetical protein